MAEVLVKKGTLDGSTLKSLTIEMHKLPTRTIDRDTVLAWMKDGHSLIPVTSSGNRLFPLQLVEVDEQLFIRHDNAREASDTLPSW